MDDGADDYFCTEEEDDDDESSFSDLISEVTIEDENRLIHLEDNDTNHKSLLHKRSNSTSTIRVTNSMEKPNHAAIINAIAQSVYVAVSTASVAKQSLLREQGLNDFTEPCYLMRAAIFDSDSSDSSDEEEKKEDIEILYNSRRLPRKNSNKENVYKRDLNKCEPQEEFVLSERKNKRNPRQEGLPPPPAVNPTQISIRDYLAKMFYTAKCSEECHIICLIYIRRLIAASGSPMAFNSYNWKPVMMTALLLASKVWDDLSMVNDDFSIFMPYTIQQINRWELKFLWKLQYNMTVTASEYAKVYFEMRAQAYQSGYDTLPSDMCNVEQAQKLNLFSSHVMERMKSMELSKAPTPTKAKRPQLRRSSSDVSSSHTSNSKGRFVLD